MARTSTWLAATLMLASCNVNPLGQPVLSVSMYVQDFRSDFGTDPVFDHRFGGADVAGSLALVVHPRGSATFEGPTLLEEAAASLWLVSLETGERVAGEGVVGLVSIDGTPQHDTRATAPFVSFVPAGPLTEGWYVLAFDRSLVAERVPVLPSYTYAEGDVEFARFHIGSRPTWRATEVSCAPAECRLVLELSEEVADLGATTVEVSHRGEAVVCREAFRGPWGISLDCDRPAEDVELVVSMTSDEIATVDGAMSQTVAWTHGRGLVTPRFGVDVTLAAR